MVLSAAVITAIGAMVIGLFTGKYFLIFIGLALFSLPFLATLTLSGNWWIVLIIVLIIIIRLTGGKK